MSLPIAIILVLIVLVIASILATTQIVTVVTITAPPEFVIEGEYTVSDNALLLPEEKE